MKFCVLNDESSSPALHPRPAPRTLTAKEESVQSQGRKSLLLRNWTPPEKSHTHRTISASPSGKASSPPSPYKEAHQGTRFPQHTGLPTRLQCFALLSNRSLAPQCLTCKGSPEHTMQRAKQRYTKRNWKKLSYSGH